MSAGWLEVTTDLEVGTAGTGIVAHTGGSLRVLGGSVAVINGAYNLSGGALTTPLLSKSAQGEFNFTGGVLSAGGVAFDLVNQGGVIAPGDSPGATHIAGDLTMNGGSILLELAGTGAGQFDEVIVDGALGAGGTMSVALLSGYSPSVGDAFDVLDFDSVSGAFALELPALAEGLAWDASELLATGAIRVTGADFDGDFDVDGGDFLRWQRGAADAKGFALWQSEFGAITGNRVPEPATRRLVWMALALGAAVRRL
jgi:hypothetical protein